jgi:hypothetical protein
MPLAAASTFDGFLPSKATSPAGWTKPVVLELHGDEGRLRMAEVG